MLKYASAALVTATVLTTSSTAVDNSPMQIFEVNAPAELGTPISPGIGVIAYGIPLTISGVKGESVSFAPDIFDNTLGFVPSAITILSLPNANSGVLKCDQTAVCVGDYISVLNLSDFTYEPTTHDDAEFCFSPDGVNIMVCKIRQKDGENTAPEVTTTSTPSTKTRLNTAVTGCLLGRDADGDGITYEISSYPSMGLIEITDEVRGIYVYHPYEGMSGTDSFKYRVKDAFGGYSDEKTVTVSVEKKNSVFYADTSSSNNITAINEMIESGIMSTNTTVQGEFFNPDAPVTRIDFLVMAMKALGADNVSSSLSTHFIDDTSLTPEEKGYLNLAYNLGIVKGSRTDGVLYFDPDRNITGNEVALILNAILGLPSDDSVSVSSMYDSIPAWALPSVSALTNAGIVNSGNFSPSLELTRENIATILSGILSRIG